VEVGTEQLLDIANRWNLAARDLPNQKIIYSNITSRSPQLMLLQTLPSGLRETKHANPERRHSLYFRQNSTAFSIPWPRHFFVDTEMLLKNYELRVSPVVRNLLRLSAETIIDIYRPAWTIGRDDITRSNAYRADYFALRDVFEVFLSRRTRQRPTTGNLREILARWIVHTTKQLSSRKSINPKFQKTLRRVLSLVLTDSLLQSNRFSQYRFREIGRSMRSPLKQNPEHPVPDSENIVTENQTPSTSGLIAGILDPTDEVLPPRSRTIIPFFLPDMPRPPVEVSPDSLLQPTSAARPFSTGTITVGVAPDESAGSTAPSFDLRPYMRGRPSSFVLSARRNIDSIFDPNRLSPGIIARYFDYSVNVHPLLLAYNWLCLFTGINWKILTALQCGPSSTSRPELPYLNLSTGILQYTILHGATEFDSSDFSLHPSALMCLSLPEMVLTAIRQCEQHNPLLGIDEQAQLQAKYFARSFQVSPTPTPERLNATFRTTIGVFSGHLDELEAACIQGEVPFHLRAQAKYRRFSLLVLNRKHRASVVDFTEYLYRIVPPTNVFSQFQPVYTAVLPDGFVGSQVYCPPEVYQKFLAATYQQYSRFHRSAGRMAHRQRLNDWVALINLQQLNLYVVEQITLGIRPVGEMLEIEITDLHHGCLVRDKASAEYTELTHSPLLPLLEAQLAACQHGLQRFKQFLRVNRISLNIDEDVVKESLAFVVSHTIVSGETEVRLSRMHGSDFERLLVQLSLDQAFDRPVDATNTFRHFLATELVSALSPVALSEFLGHQRRGLEYYSPWSTVRGPLLPKITKAIEAIIENIGLRVLRVSL
jgi:hypothetical protein